MYDRLEDVAKALDAAPLAVLQAAKIDPLDDEICWSDDESIVYKNQAGQVTTAWTRTDKDGRRKVIGIERGMPMWPSPYIAEQAA